MSSFELLDFLYEVSGYVWMSPSTQDEVFYPIIVGEAGQHKAAFNVSWSVGDNFIKNVDNSVYFADPDFSRKIKYAIYNEFGNIWDNDTTLNDLINRYIKYGY